MSRMILLCILLVLYTPPTHSLPSNLTDWRPLLQSPCTHLLGPHCGGGGGVPMQDVGVVGAGIAGLTLAWLLQSVGHNVTLLEATHRYGGRVHTVYGEGWYGDLGAMRFPSPQIQPLMHHTFRQFKVPLTNFTNYNEGQNSYYFLNGKYYSSKAYHDNNVDILEELYSLFNIDTTKENSIIKDDDGHLINAGSVLKEKILRKEDIAAAENCSQSVEMFLRDRLQAIAGNGTYAPMELVTMWSVTELLRAYLPDSFYMYVTSTPELLHEEGFTEIINGTSQLADILFSNISATAKHFQYLPNTPVSEARHAGGRVHLTTNHTTQLFHKVAFTIPARQVSLVKFTPSLEYNKKYALDTFHYMTSVKVFLAFSTPFWSNSTNNKVPPIMFHPCTTTPCHPRGGSGITDLPIRTVLYPSHSYHGNSLLASYVWEDDANRLTSFSDSSLIELVLDNLVTIHGEVVRETYINNSGVVKQWVEDEFVGSGAFPWGYPYQVQTLQEALTKVAAPFYFAGDYTSPTSHTWVQDAVESACRVANTMFGNSKPLQ